jgi:hypothetical protein
MRFLSPIFASGARDTRAVITGVQMGEVSNIVDQRTTQATRIGSPEHPGKHEVIDDELRASAIDLAGSFSLGPQGVVFLNADHRQSAPLRGQRVARPGSLLLSAKDSFVCNFPFAQ